MTISFWNNNHPLSPLADELGERFIPMSGDTTYQQSEVMRAALKLHHDYYNNGFGNNMSQPVVFIENYYLPMASKEFRTAFESIKEMALEPWNRLDLDDDFNLVMAEIVTMLKRDADGGVLIPLAMGMWEMPRTEMVYPSERDEEENDYYA